MKVQILQCEPKKWMPFSWLIKVFQKTNYSHYAIGFCSISGEYMILDATGKGVQLKGSLHFLDHYEIKKEFTVEFKYSYEDFCSWYEPLLGESYGFLQIIGILIKNKKLGRGITCNELVLRFLRRFTRYSDSGWDTKDLNDTELAIRCLMK